MANIKFSQLPTTTSLTGATIPVVQAGNNYIAPASLFLSASSAGNVAAGNLISAGVITAVGNIQGGNLTTTGTAAVNILTATGNILSSGNISITGNIQAGNLITSGNIFDLTGSLQISSTGTIVLTPTGVTSSTGNVSAPYFLGNGSALTGIVSTYSNANVASYMPVYNGNIAANTIQGNVGTFTYNVTGSNLVSNGYVSALGNIYGSYHYGNGYYLTGITVSLSGNVSGNISASGSVSDSLGLVRTVPVESKSTSYTLAQVDSGQCVSITTGGVTVPASVLPAGTVITIYNNSASSQTITQGSGLTMQWAGQTTSTTGSRILGPYGLATVIFINTTTAAIAGAGLS